MEEAGLHFSCSPISGALQRSGAFPRQLCQLCSVAGDAGDQDSRRGYFKAEVRFGPAAVRGRVNETYVSEYRVYVVDGEGRRLGAPVAVVGKRLLPPPDECCSSETYAAVVELNLGSWRGASSLVVHVVAAGFELPVGAEVAPIRDQYAPEQREVVTGQVLAGCVNFVLPSAVVGVEKAAVAQALASAADLAAPTVEVVLLATGETCPGALEAPDVDSGRMILASYEVYVPEGAAVADVAARLGAGRGAVEAALIEALPVPSLEVLPLATPVLAERRLPPEVDQWTCDDAPAQWRSATGRSCADYAAYRWCTANGTEGARWDFGFGRLRDFADAGGLAASDACCACGGGRGVGRVVGERLFAVTSGSACAELLPYGAGRPSGLGVDTGLGEEPHLRWRQWVYPEGAAGSEDDLLIEWRFSGEKTLRQRFVDATSQGEAVRWLVLWRGRTWEKQGTWFFSSATSATMPFKWGPGAIDSGGFATDNGVWGAATGAVDGDRYPPQDFVGVGVFTWTDVACSIVCFPLGSAGNDCQQRYSVRANISMVTEPATCEASVCTGGKALKAAGWRAEFCASDVCEEEECCAFEGECESLDCSRYGEPGPGGLPAYVPQVSPPPCASENCTYAECCELPYSATQAVGASSSVALVFVIIGLLFMAGCLVYKRERMSACLRRGKAKVAPGVEPPAGPELTSVVCEAPRAPEVDAWTCQAGAGSSGASNPEAPQPAPAAALPAPAPIAQTAPAAAPDAARPARRRLLPQREVLARLAMPTPEAHPAPTLPAP